VRRHDELSSATSKGTDAPAADRSELEKQTTCPTGTAPRQDSQSEPRTTKTRSHARPPSSFHKVELRALACGAIRRLGWKPSVAAAAVDAVLDELGTDISVDVVIRAALPRCHD
jgi:hypothetical protein